MKIMKKVLSGVMIMLQLLTSLSSMIWMVYGILLGISLFIIADPGNLYNPQIGQDLITRTMLYLLEHQILIMIVVVNIFYSSIRGFEKSSKHLGLE